jgi:uncharacterized protein with HEPN domain
MTKRPREEDRLRHMLDAAREAVQFIKGKKRSDLDANHQLALALTRLVEVLGEAARHVSLETRRKYTRIPWREIAGTRDRLIHGYFDVDLDILWQIVSKDLPPLIRELEKVISET